LIVEGHLGGEWLCLIDFFDFVLIDEDDLLVKVFLESLNLIKILFFFVFDILFMDLYFLFDFSFVLKN
jgi:hypothetical protein